MHRVLIGIFLVLFVIWSLFPIFWNVLTSMKERVDIFTVRPKILFKPTFKYYAEAFSSGPSSIYPHVVDSVIVMVGTIVLTLAIAPLAAYAFSRFKFKGRRLFFFLILGTRLLPPISSVVPLFMMMDKLRLIDTHLVLILVTSGLSLPLSVWMLKAFVDTIPRELDQAALLDGCSKIQAIWHVTVPLLATGLAATTVFVFVLVWNEFMFAFMLTGANVQTLPLAIATSRGEDQFLWQLMATYVNALMFPALLLAWFLQKHLVSGLNAGAVQ
jgi:multiple sugar transport system permease protein